MKVPFRQLDSHLNRSLAKVYLVAGDEPLLIDEALEQVRAAAMRAGFTSRELHTADRSFKWVDLLAGADNLSLFATRKIVEIRLATPKPGDDGSETIAALCEREDPDTLDGLQWYCEKCNNLLHEYRFHLDNIEKDFIPRFRDFYGSKELRTCKKCGTVMQADPRFI